MSFVNICRNNSDLYYRYKMPSIQSKIEGRGNGIKTAIMNLGEVSRALGRPPAYLVKFFGYELGAQTSINEELERYLVNGSHDSTELQDSLDGFIHKFVLCGMCKNPETEVQVKNKAFLEKDCKACGKTTVIDLKHKLSSYILKNPPNFVKKGKKFATVSVGACGGKTISDIVTLQISPTVNFEKKNDFENDIYKLKDKNKTNINLFKSTNNKIDEWAMDMSQEAVAARAREIEQSDFDSMELRYNNFGEWLLKEVKSSENLIVHDVDIYKKIAGFSIIDKPETVQVLGQVLFTENILDQISSYKSLLLKLIDGKEEFQKAFLGGLERYIGLEKPELITKISEILLKLYNSDILDENVLIFWGGRISKKYVPKEISKQLRKAAKPFIKWLQEADEESE